MFQDVNRTLACPGPGLCHNRMSSVQRRSLIRGKTPENTWKHLKTPVKTPVWAAEPENDGFNDPILKCSFKFFLSFPDNFYKVEGAKDALICGNSSDAGWVFPVSCRRGGGGGQRRETCWWLWRRSWWLDEVMDSSVFQFIHVLKLFLWWFQVISSFISKGFSRCFGCFLFNAMLILGPWSGCSNCQMPSGLSGAAGCSGLTWT